MQVGFLEVCSLLVSRVLFKSSPNQHPFVTNHLKVSCRFNPKSFATQTQKSVFVVLMAEILHQLIGSLLTYRVFYIPGGCLGFLPSMVCPQELSKEHDSSTKRCPEKNMSQGKKHHQTCTAMAGILQGSTPTTPKFDGDFVQGPWYTNSWESGHLLSRWYTWCELNPALDLANSKKKPPQIYRFFGEQNGGQKAIATTI